MAGHDSIASIADGPPRSGRVFRSTARIRVSDTDVRGRLRLDGAARVLQDLSSDDTDDAALGDTGIWVLRRLELRVERRPALGDRVDLTTWCSGTGPRWAERRSDLTIAARHCLAAAALWVYTDRVTGAPVPLDAGFVREYAPAAGGRRVSARLGHGAPPPAATRIAWDVRTVDLDVMGHVNNAVYWAPVESSLGDRAVASATIEFRGGVDARDAVEIVAVDDAATIRQWWLVGGDVRAATVARLR